MCSRVPGKAEIRRIPGDRVVAAREGGKVAAEAERGGARIGLLRAGRAGETERDSGNKTAGPRRRGTMYHVNYGLVTVDTVS